MSDLLPFIVIGITTGSVYAIASTGLVLTYKTTGLFNFGHGALAAAGAYMFYELHYKSGLAWPLAALLCIAVFGPCIGLIIELLARGLAPATTAYKLVATVGLLVGLESLFVVLYGPAARPFPQFLPTTTYSILGANVADSQIITVVLALALVGGLAVFLRRTRLGVAMLGVVDSPELLGLTGTSPSAVRRAAWMIGSSFAVMSGLLLAPSVGLNPLVLTLLVVQAFGAAAIGRFSSLPLTYVGALVVGLGSAISTKYVAGFTFLAGVPASVPFLVLFGVLLFSPKGRLVEAGAQYARQVVNARRPSPAARRAGLLVALVVGLLVPNMVGSKLLVYTTALAYIVIFASLGLLVRTSGQISLCQLGLAAIGAAVFSHLTVDLNVPWALAVVIAGLAAVPVGALVAIPAIRLSGLYLALATYGFGILLETLIYTSRAFFGSTGSLTAPRPDVPFIHATDRAYYYVVLAVVVLCLGFVALVERSRLGRLLRALADSPVALSTHGANVNVIRTLVFCISAFLAGIGGAVLGPVTGSVSSISFNSFTSLTLLAVLAIVGAGLLRSAMFAAVAFVVIPAYVENVRFQEALPMLFGLSAVAVAIASSGAVDAGAILGRLARRWAWRSQRSPVTDRLEGLVPAHLLSRAEPLPTAAPRG